MWEGADHGTDSADGYMQIDRGHTGTQRPGLSAESNEFSVDYDPITGLPRKSYARPAMRPGPPEIPQKIRDIFAEVDVNQSGFIDFGEIRRALQLYGFDASDDECAKILRAYDDNPDGKLDISEFANLLADLERGRLKTDAEEEEKICMPIPEGLAAGDAFEVATSKGERIRVTVPAGASAGDVITIRVTSRHVLVSWEPARKAKPAPTERSPAYDDQAGKARGLLAEQMVKHVGKKEEQIRHVFEKHDANGDGELSLPELWAVLQECHPSASENQVHRAASKAMGKADANRDCVLSFDEFISCYNELVDLLSPAPSKANHGAAKMVTPPSVDQIHRQLQESVNSQFASLKQAFKALDSSGAGQISNEQFVNVLMGSGMPVPQEDLKLLVSAYDTNGDGYVDYLEFERALSANGGRAVRISDAVDDPTGAVNQQALMARLIAAEQALRSKIHEKYHSITEAFIALDEDSSGSLEAFEFAQLLRQNNIQVTDQEMAVMIERYDQNGDGRIDINELNAFLMHE